MMVRNTVLIIEASTTDGNAYPKHRIRKICEALENEGLKTKVKRKQE